MKGMIIASIFLSLLLSVNLNFALAADIYLKSGDKYSGEILSYDGEKYKVKTKYGEVIINKDDILEIKMEERERIEPEKTAEEKEEIQKVWIQPRKSPGTAAFLSFLIPGLGQLYDEKLWDALGMPAAIASAIILFESEELAAFFYVFNIMDAYWSAEEFNKKHGYSLRFYPGENKIALSYARSF